MGVTFKVQSPVSTGLFYARIDLETGKEDRHFLVQYQPEKIGAKFALSLNFHPKPPSYIITRRKTANANNC